MATTNDTTDTALAIYDREITCDCGWKMVIRSTWDAYNAQALYHHGQHFALAHPESHCSYCYYYERQGITPSHGGGSSRFLSGN